MGALGYYLESEGIATTQISLVREHTAALHPPRALWVPFMLGRPFGVPADPAFQRRVLLAALRLLELPAGPVLADYPEDAPPAPGVATESGGVCPVSFGRVPDTGDLGALLAREIEALAPWHDLAVQRRGRTTTGSSGVTIEEAARIAAAGLHSAPAAQLDGMSAGETLKLVCDEIRAYYYEAAGAQPGQLDAAGIQRWFWHDTAAGRFFLALQKICVAADDPTLRVFGGNSLVPRAIKHELG